MMGDPRHSRVWTVMAGSLERRCALQASGDRGAPTPPSLLPPLEEGGSRHRRRRRRLPISAARCAPPTPPHPPTPLCQAVAAEEAPHPLSPLPAAIASDSRHSQQPTTWWWSWPAARRIVPISIAEASPKGVATPFPAWQMQQTQRGLPSPLTSNALTPPPLLVIVSPPPASARASTGAQPTKGAQPTAGAKRTDTAGRW